MSTAYSVLGAGGSQSTAMVPCASTSLEDMKRWMFLGVVGFLLVAAYTIEPLDDPGLGELALTSVVYAADGSILAEFHAAEHRVLVSYDELPSTLVDAVVAIEDERFWQHTGVDLQAVARALVENLQDRAVSQGGSTITLQYLKNVVLTPEVTLDRKVTEAALALRLEQGLEKEEILENYLNTVYFGNSSYGVGAASNRYFGKHVSEISLAESATLAGLIQAPSSYDPHKNPDAAIGRQRIVSKRWQGSAGSPRRRHRLPTPSPCDSFPAPLVSRFAIHTSPKRPNAGSWHSRRWEIPSPTDTTQCFGAV